MPMHIRMFELLSYAGLALGIFCTFWRFNFPKDELVIVGSPFLVMALLIWIAARKGQVWAAWILAIWLVLTGVVVFALLADQRVPDFLSLLRPFGRPPSLYKLVDLVGLALSALGLFYYFFGKRA